MGPGGAAAGRAAVAAARRHARARSPRASRSASRTRSTTCAAKVAHGARRRLSAHQDQDQARLGRRRRRGDPRALRRHPADGGRQRRLHARRRRAPRRARSLRPDDDRAAARLRRHPRSRGAAARGCATPICLDESIHSVRAAEEAIALGACRIINIKPGPRRRPRPSRSALHDLCAAHGIPVWHGGMLESGIGRAHNIHLASLPNFTLPGDIAASRRYFVPDLIEPGDRGQPRRARSRCRRARASASRSIGIGSRRRRSRRYEVSER